MTDTPDTTRHFPARRGEGQTPVGLVPGVEYRLGGLQRVSDPIGARPEVTGWDVTVRARTNLDDALEIVEEIDRVRSVIRELKAAFAKSELDGGVKAAPKHPLYIEAQEKLDQLHDQLMMVI